MADTAYPTGSLSLGAFKGNQTIVHDPGPPAPPSEPPDPDPAALLQARGYTRLGGQPGKAIAPISPRWTWTNVPLGLATKAARSTPPPAQVVAGYTVHGRMGTPPLVVVPSTEPGPYWNQGPYDVGSGYAPGDVVTIKRSGFAESVGPDCYRFQIGQQCLGATFTVVRDDGQAWDGNGGVLQLGVLAYGSFYDQFTVYPQSGQAGVATGWRDLYTGYTGFVISWKSYTMTPYDYTLTIAF